MARHVIDTFFRDTLNPMVRHHIDSYDDFLEYKLPLFIKNSNPISLVLDEERSIRVYIGKKDGTAIRYIAPIDEEELAVLPHSCRLSNKTYTFKIEADIDVEYEYNKEIELKHFENIFIGSIPLLLKSSMCYLRGMDSDKLYKSGECKYELGGYFIVSGQERVLLTQESLGANMFYAKKAAITSAAPELRSRSEKSAKLKMEGTRSQDVEYIAGLFSVSEDGTKHSNHYMKIPPRNLDVNDSSRIGKEKNYANFSTNRLAVIQISGFDNPIPLFSLFYALGATSDQDIYDAMLVGVPEKSIYDTTFAELILSHEKFVLAQKAKEDDQDQDMNLMLLKRETRTRSPGQVYSILYSKLFPHCEKQDESVPAFYRRKIYILAKMLKMAVDVSLDLQPDTDRDNFRFKRLQASGDLCFNMFREIYTTVSASLKLALDSRIEFEKQLYKGKLFMNLIQEETLRSTRYWKSYLFITDFEKAFKGTWQQKSGVSQVLSRYSYVGTIAHLRRINLDMDHGTKQRAPRKLHASGWGLLCPIDNPDGSSIGMVKSLTLLSRISTQIPSSELKQIILSQPNVESPPNPSMWNPVWTPIFLNSDLICIVTKDTDSFHEFLLGERRAGRIHKFISLNWNRTNNEYLIYSDAGRPCRPIYREGIKLETIKAAKTWKSITSHMDYLDAQEAEGVRISMEPFHHNYLSEIHGTIMFSPSASINPFSEHNQAPRNMFTCQQAKQACSWYNTAFAKRFDTIATVMHYPQRALSQTWTWSHILGCLPYGENAIVAIGSFNGYNQEDSIILNNSAMKRGMFQISYYHCHDIQEEITNSALQIHTEIANPAENPKYRETVNRKEGRDYSLLDGDGIIRIGSTVEKDTVLVGMLSPKLNTAGQVVAYMDISVTPKRGERGIIDAIHNYTTVEGVRGVKIRIASFRQPTLGDKFGSRHGQKGTCGMLMEENDIPFMASGLRPDLIINPHALPTRMTIGQFLEQMSNKIGLHIGSMIDGTAFCTQDRVGSTKEILLQLGYHSHGNEILFNGMTGEMIQSEIFMGPSYYHRFKHMVEDKINYRTTGPKTLLTHQPAGGRSNDGGLRIGEMERDSIISHGISKFLNESMMDRSDGHKYLYQPDTGLLDADNELPTQEIEMPYSMGLFVHEIESMHLQVKLTSG